jgi:hypothetical protein
MKTKTHIIEYIYTNKDSEYLTFNDLTKLIKGTTRNSSCMIDIMMITGEYASFVHIENGSHSFQQIPMDTFYTKKVFEQFMKICINNEIGIAREDIDRFFILGGHCNGWRSYVDNNTVDMKMLRDTFITKKIDFDMFCFDSCYSSTLELLYQFSDISKYIIAHQVYVNNNGFNTVHISKIFDKPIKLEKKLILSCLDYIVNTIKYGEFESVTLIDTSKFNIFMELYKKNYKKIKSNINSKVLQDKYTTDICTPYIGDCKNMNNPSDDCFQSICNNIIDLYYLIDMTDMKMLKILEQSVFYRMNGVKKNKKYFRMNQQFKGINVIIDPKKSDKLVNYNTYYTKLRFFKDFN